jgi:hypothetical protein
VDRRRSQRRPRETTAVRADFLGERGGFEPMAIAVSRPRIAGFRQRISKEMRGRPDCGRRRSANATATVARRCADDCRTRRSNWRSSRRSPFLNRAEPHQGHRYFDCRRKCSLTFSPYPPAACIGQNHSPEGTGWPIGYSVQAHVCPSRTATGVRLTRWVEFASLFQRLGAEVTRSCARPTSCAASMRICGAQTMNDAVARHRVAHAVPKRDVPAANHEKPARKLG